MKTLLTLVAALLLLARPVGADTGGVQAVSGGDNPGTNTPAAVALVDAWNDSGTPTTGYAYAASCFGYPYVPSKTYDLDRVEFFAGDVGGLVTVSILADDGSGLPTGPVLGSVTYMETTPRRWQGASFCATGATCWGNALLREVSGSGRGSLLPGRRG